MKKKFEVVLNIPSPYRLHLLRELDRQLSDLGWEFEAHFMSRGHKERPKSWLNPQIGFAHKYWRDFGIGSHHLNLGLVLRLIFFKRDVLLVGSPFDTFTGILCALFARADTKMCWIEGNTKTPGRLDGILGWLKRYILSKFTSVVVPGAEGAGYIELHKARTSLKLPYPVFLPNLIDETRFKPRSKWNAECISKCRGQIGAKAGELICLIPARLIPVKGLIPFIESIKAEWVARWRLVIIGQGELKDRFILAANKIGVADRIRILDYVPYEEMPLYYAAADLFLLPSVQDMNPLCVPEALHSGLPMAVSDCVGNVTEGVSDGKNGWVLPVVDSKRYSEKLKDIFAANINTLHSMGAISYSVNARFWDTKESIRRFLKKVLG